MTGSAVTFAAVLAGLLVAHDVADHWVQTDAQAVGKGRRGRVGRRACVGHVATYTLVTATTVAALWVLLALPITPAGFLAGQATSAVTHYWADRRLPLARLAHRVGRGRLYRLGADVGCLGTGGYALDQSFHRAWLLIAALLTAVA